MSDSEVGLISIVDSGHLSEHPVVVEQKRNVLLVRSDLVVSNVSEDIVALDFVYFLDVDVEKLINHKFVNDWWRWSARKESDARLYVLSELFFSVNSPNVLDIIDERQVEVNMQVRIF